MRILIVNPNTTSSMTETIGRAGRVVAAAGTEIIAVNPVRTGYAAIADAHPVAVDVLLELGDHGERVDVLVADDAPLADNPTGRPFRFVRLVCRDGARSVPCGG